MRNENDNNLITNLGCNIYVEFNKTVITPRRFITEVTVGTAKTAHGDKYVYKFMPHKILPNETVKEIMDKSQALMDKFEKQYNKTSSVQLPGSGAESSAVIQENSGVTFEDDVELLSIMNINEETFKIENYV